MENLLRFSRQTHRIAQSIDFTAEIVQDVLALREYHVRTRDVEIIVDIEPNFPPVVTDEDQCKQVLLNLINRCDRCSRRWKGAKAISVGVFSSVEVAP